MGHGQGRGHFEHAAPRQTAVPLSDHCGDEALVARAAGVADALSVGLDVAGGVVVDHVYHGGPQHVVAAPQHVGADDDRGLVGARVRVKGEW